MENVLRRSKKWINWKMRNSYYSIEEQIRLYCA
jgi:hypothetical protein